MSVWASSFLLTTFTRARGFRNVICGPTMDYRDDSGCIVNPLDNLKSAWTSTSSSGASAP